MSKTLAIAVKSHNRKSVIQKYHLKESHPFLDQTNDPLETEVPFKSYLPHIVYNSCLKKLEVFGDFVWPYAKRSKNITYPTKNHYFLDGDLKIWEEVKNSTYDSRSYSAGKFIDNLGTVIVGGILDYKTLSSVIVITKCGESNYDENHILPKLNQARRQHSVTVYETKMIVAGGLMGMSHEIDQSSRSKGFLLNSIEVLDLKHLEKWEFLDPLKTKIRGGSFIESPIGFLWFGWSGSESSSKSLEIVDKTNIRVGLRFV